MRYLPLSVLVLSSLGCVTPCHKANMQSLAPEGLDTETTLAERSRVQVFVLNGSDPFVTLTALRTRLHDAGFAKVSIGGLLYAPLFEAKIRQLHRDDPEAQVVLIGYGFGVGSADGLAKKLHAEGLPIATVVALSPLAVPGFESVPDASIPRVVLRGRATPLQLTDERTFAFDDETMANDVIASVVTDVLLSMPRIETATASALAMIDDPAPRPVVRTGKPVIAVPVSQKK